MEQSTIVPLLHFLSTSNKYYFFIDFFDKWLTNEPYSNERISFLTVHRKNVPIVCNESESTGSK